MQPLKNLREAGINGFLSSILVLTGITFVSAKVGFFPIPIVIAGVISILIGFAFGLKAAYLTFIYYRNGGFSQ